MTHYPGAAPGGPSPCVPGAAHAGKNPPPPVRVGLGESRAAGAIITPPVPGSPGPGTYFQSVFDAAFRIVDQEQRGVASSATVLCGGMDGFRHADPEPCRACSPGDSETPPGNTTASFGRCRHSWLPKVDASSSMPFRGSRRGTSVGGPSVERLSSGGVIRRRMLPESSPCPRRPAESAREKFLREAHHPRPLDRLVFRADGNEPITSADDSSPALAERAARIYRSIASP